MLKFSILCNDSTNVESQEIGDPTETAMVSLEIKRNFAQEVRDACPRSSEVPFDSDRKLMSTFHKMKDGYTMITKGAVDVMLKRVLYPERWKNLSCYRGGCGKHLQS